MKYLSILLTLLCLSGFTGLSAQLETIVTGLDVPNGISVYNNSLYFTQAFGDEVSKFDLDDPAAVVEAILDVDTPSGTFVLGNDLYIANGIGDDPGVYRLNLQEANPTPEIVTEPIAASNLFIEDSVLYLTTVLEQSVLSLDLTDEDATLQTIATDFNGPNGIVVICDDLFVTEFNGGQVAKVDLTDNSVSAYLTDLDRPNGIAVNGGLLYVTENDRINSVNPNDAIPTKTLVIDGLDQARDIAFRGAELYIVEAIGIVGTGQISRFVMPIEFPGNNARIAIGVDSLLGGLPNETTVTRLYDNTGYDSSGESNGTECFLDASLDQTIWYRFTGDGNTYEIKTNIDGAANPIGDDQAEDTQLAIYTGGNCGLSPLACNDDEDAAMGALNARVEIVTEIGVDYYFFVDAVNDSDPDGGEFRLEVTRQGISSTRNITDLKTTIYPNPTDGILYFQGTSPTHVVVLDAMGRRVLTSKIRSNQLDLSTFPNGLYSLFSQLPDGTWTSSKVVRR